MVYRIVNEHGHVLVGIPPQRPENVVGFLCKILHPTWGEMSMVEVLTGPLTGIVLELNHDPSRLVAYKKPCPMEANHV